MKLLKSFRQTMACLLTLSVFLAMFAGLGISPASAASLDDIRQYVILDFDFNNLEADADGVITAVKSSDGSLTASAYNVTRTEGRDGGYAVSFSSEGDNISTGICFSPENGSDPMADLGDSGVAISMWIKPDTDMNNVALFLYGDAAPSDGSSGGSTNNSLYILGQTQSGKDVATYRKNGGTNQQKLKLSGNYTWEQNTWQLFTFVEEADGKTIKFYINGNLMNTYTHSGSTYNTLKGIATSGLENKYYIGYQPVWPDNTHFQGAIDSFEVYGKALTAEEVKLLYKGEDAVITLGDDPVTLTAEDALLSGKAALVNIKDADNNSTGEKYIGEFGNGENNTATFTVTAPADGTYRLDIYYNNGGSSRNLVVTVNGDTDSTQTLACPYSGEWGKAGAEKAISTLTNLTEGANTIVFGNPVGYAPNLYRVVLTKIKTVGGGDEAVTLFAAKDGELGGQAASQYNGEPCVGWIGYDEKDAVGDEGTVTFTVDAAAAGTYSMDVYYLSKQKSNGENSDRTCIITVNSDTESAVSLFCPQGSSWTDVSLASVASCEVTLSAGNNTICFGNPNGNAPTLYKIVLTKKAETVSPGFSIGISDGAVTPVDEKFNITWNAMITLDPDKTLEEINDRLNFKDYGVYYGTSETAVRSLADGKTTDQAKKLSFNMSSDDTDISVYTIFGFRLKNVAAGRERAAMFYVTYETDGTTYTVFSDCITVSAAEA